MNYALRSGIVVAFVIVALVAFAQFKNSWYSAPAPFAKCLDQGLLFAADEPQFQKCLEKQSEALLAHDYPEFKDLGKAFLTLLSATLVLSITFSEKVVDLNNAPSSAVSALFACWALLFMAIAACGGALAFISHAAWTAKYDLRLNFYVAEVRAVSLLMFSLATFVCALGALVVAGAISVVHRRL